MNHQGDKLNLVVLQIALINIHRTVSHIEIKKML